MDDQLDDDLKNRIREVFENYEDASADEGWMLLREKFPEKAKKRSIAWIWWGTAAVLLISLGILWLNKTRNTTQQFAINKKHPAGNSIAKVAAKKNLEDSSALQQSEQHVADNVTPPNTIPENKANKLNPAVQTANKPAAIALGKPNPHNGISPVNTMPASLNQVPSNQQNLAPLQAGITVTASKSEIQKNNQATIKNNAVLQTDTSPKAPAKTYATAPVAVASPGVDMQEQVKQSRKIFENNTATAKNPEKSKKTDKAITFGIYTATYFNYAKGSSNQLNLGAGLSSDISLSKNLKLSTGISIAQNTLSYAEQPPPSPGAQQSFIAAANVATKNYAAMSQYAAAAPSFKNYNASLVGLDIPLNLKFIIDPQKSDTYISAGLSSGTFINENYVYSYNNPAPFSASVSQVQDQSSHQSFNGFYFAKTLNFSFGTGFPVGGNRLILEPFLKYPLDGLGSQQIRFGAGGLNLKFNFQNQKK